MFHRITTAASIKDGAKAANTLNKMINVNRITNRQYFHGPSSPVTAVHLTIKYTI